MPLGAWAKHTAIFRPYFKKNATVFVFIEPLVCVSWDYIGLLVTASGQVSADFNIILLGVLFNPLLGAIKKRAIRPARLFNNQRIFRVVCMHSLVPAAP